MGDKSVFTLITGASRGIGKAFAIECASRGHNLALVALPNEDLDALCTEISKEHRVQVIGKECDLSIQGAPKEVYDWCQELGIKVQVLINNAGFGSTGAFDTHPTEFYTTMVNLNVLAMVQLTSLFLPHLKELDRAYIVNMSSASGFFPVPQKVIYSATKAFILNVSRSLQRELRNTNVKVTVICPNGVPTTEAVRERVETLGWKGRMTTVEADYLAKLGMDSLYKGKTVVVPGWFNRMSIFISWLLPTKVAMGFMEKQFTKELLPKDKKKDSPSKKTKSRHLN